MKGYTINKSIDLLENEVDDLKESQTGGTAADISYDNTGTGLEATNVQGALTEIDTRSNYSTTEHKIGKWIDGSDLYEKTIVTNKTNVVANSSVDITSDINALGAEKIIFYDVRLYFEVADTSPLITGNFISTPDLARLILESSSSSIKLNIGSATYSKLDIVWTVQYIKTASESTKSRKKK